MSYTLATASVSDVPDIVTIFDAAFAADPFIPHFFTAVPQDVRTRYSIARYSQWFEQPELFGMHMWKVVDQQDKMVGFGKWAYPHTLTADQRAEREQLEKQRETSPALPEGTNRPLREAFFDGITAKKKLYYDETRDFFLHILAVHPEHQGQGVSSLLIRKGLADADAAGARTYIEASPRGLPVYLKFGWKEVDRIVMDTRQVGVADGGLAAEVCMMRDPQ